MTVRIKRDSLPLPTMLNTSDPDASVQRKQPQTLSRLSALAPAPVRASPPRKPQQTLLRLSATAAPASQRRSSEEKLTTAEGTAVTQQEHVARRPFFVNRDSADLELARNGRDRHGAVAPNRS